MSDNFLCLRVARALGVLVLALALDMGCSSSGGGSAPAPAPANVCAGGTVTTNAGFAEGIYWLNGDAVSLGMPGAITAMAAAGSDIYAAGSSATSPTGAVVWKDGLPTPLQGTAPGQWTTVQAMAVSGSDVYAGGSLNANLPAEVAAYWKNGVPVVLGDGTYQSWLNAIFVQGTDVYAAGQDGGAGCYWLNGQETLLATTLGQAITAGIAVAPSGDVLIAGYTVSTSGLFQATLWRNNVPSLLGSNPKGSRAFAVAAAGGDVYVAGFVSNGSADVATVWQNGNASGLSDGNNVALGLAIAVSGSDVYVAGSNGGNACYWKNGQEVDLAGGANGTLNAICIVQP